MADLPAQRAELMAPYRHPWRHVAREVAAESIEVRGAGGIGVVTGVVGVIGLATGVTLMAFWIVAAVFALLCAAVMWAYLTAEGTIPLLRAWRQGSELRDGPGAAPARGLGGPGPRARPVRGDRRGRRLAVHVALPAAARGTRSRGWSRSRCRAGRATPPR